ncbi:hypothetical protein L596_021951 [Steinernema carpocapsae]|uniref:Uncharacterized protein n=1 Tax=Steinernema carpocapsae TaxID=34508 RepID=A0A4U5MKM6_STECR|nr:hypothetical protein L596_021951 [Steinernema carpocapsae]
MSVSSQNCQTTENLWLYLLTFDQILSVIFENGFMTISRPRNPTRNLSLTKNLVLSRSEAAMDAFCVYKLAWLQNVKFGKN